MNTVKCAICHLPVPDKRDGRTPLCSSEYGLTPNQIKYRSELYAKYAATK